MAGVVLAAGEGRRLGGPKALVRLSPPGSTLLESAVATLARSGLRVVHVVVGAAAEAVTDELESLRPKAVRTGTDLSWSFCDDWRTGMGASLRRGLQWARHDEVVDAAVLHLLDLPGVTSSAVGRILRVAQESCTPPAGLRRALVRASFDGRPGHPVLIGADHWDAVSASAHGDAGARDYLRKTEHLLVEVGDIADGADLDTREDLEQATRRWSGLSLGAVGEECSGG